MEVEGEGGVRMEIGFLSRPGSAKLVLGPDSLARILTTNFTFLNG